MLKKIINKLKNCVKFCFDKRYRLAVRFRRNKYDALPDKKYLEDYYYYKFGKKLDLKDPKTFNEKLQWLKLYDRDPKYTMMVDKYAVKKYVADIIGEEHVIPTLGVWDKFDDIDFDALPDKFVLKTTHDSGGLYICKDKSVFDKEKARAKIEKSLHREYYLSGREWPYKNVPKRIIAEKFLSGLDDGSLVEYKLFCFNGVVKMVLVCKGEAHRTDGVRTNDYLDIDFNRLPFTSLNPVSKIKPEKPENFDRVIAFAEKLSEGLPEVRADFYMKNDEIYFGELTFFHNSGFMKFEPEEWDLKIGEWVELPHGGKTDGKKQ